MPTLDQVIAGAPAAFDGGGSGRHLSFYGLTTAPFRASADLRRPWLGMGQRSALDTLVREIHERDGLFVLTGDVGTGKTFLAGRLADLLQGSGLLIGKVSVSSPGLDPADFFEAVLNAFGGKRVVSGREAFHAALGHVLARTATTADRALLVIDEAQSLHRSLLDEVRELSVAAATWDRPLAILLVGESRLSVAVAEERHSALRQRIVAQAVITPLADEEVGAYLRHCLEGAGATSEIFSAEAIRKIAPVSRGAPGAINILADRALLLGEARRVRPISWAIVEECSRPTGGARIVALEPVRQRRGAGDPSRHSRPADRAGRRRRVYVIGVATVLLVTGAPYLAWWLAGIDRQPARVSMPDTPVGQAVLELRPREAEPPDATARDASAPIALPARAEIVSTKPPAVPSAAPSAPERRAPVAASPRQAHAGLREQTPAPKVIAPSRETPLPVERRLVPPALIERAPDRPAPAATPIIRAQAPDARPDAPDPSAIIDWLMKEAPGKP